MDTSTVASGERTCAKALEWLWNTREQYVLPPAPSTDLVDVQLFKVLGEIAMTGWVVRREGAVGSAVRGRACDLLDFVWEQFDGGEMLYRMLVRNPAAPHSIEVYSMLHAAGYRHERLHEFIGHLLTLRSYHIFDLLPNRQVGLAAAVRRLGFTPWARPADLAEGTWLGGLPEPWMLDTYNAYSVTHTVFHLTDHGADPGGVPEHLRDYLLKWLPVWLDVYTETGFWDLLGELLMVRDYIAAPDTDPEPWRRFAQAQHEDGMMPNGVNRPTDDIEVRARAHYHATVVAAIAGTFVASRGLTAVAAG